MYLQLRTEMQRYLTQTKPTATPLEVGLLVAIVLSMTFLVGAAFYFFINYLERHPTERYDSEESACTEYSSCTAEEQNEFDDDIGTPIVHL